MEGTLEVTVQFAHFSQHGAHSGCSIGPLIEAEKYKLPSHYTCQQLLDHVKKETTHTWNGKPFTDFCATAKKVDVYFRFDALREELDLSMTLGELLKKHPLKKPDKPFLFNFGVYDSTAQAEVKDKYMQFVQQCTQRMPQLIDLMKNPAGDLSDAQLMEILLFPWSSVCPYNYVLVPEGSVANRDEYIKENSKNWKENVTRVFDKLLSSWVSHSPEHLEQLSSVLTSKTCLTAMAAVPEEGIGRGALGKLTHYVRPFTDSNEDRHWAQLFDRCIPVQTQFKFLYALRMSAAFEPRWSAYLIPREWFKQVVDRCGGASVFSKPPGSELPREFIDSFLGVTPFDKPMPDILPPDAELAALSSEEIERRVSEYTGIEVEALHTLLYPEGSSGAGFLKQGDRLGAVIKKDAQYLVSQSVSRHMIADFLEKAMANSNSDGFPMGPLSAPTPVDPSVTTLRVCSIRWMGFQTDPFHPTFGNPAAKGASCDYQINPGKLGFPGMITTLIRRLCFFESSDYRVAPEHVVPLLNKDFEKPTKRR